MIKVQKSALLLSFRKGFSPFINLLKDKFSHIILQRQLIVLSIMKVQKLAVYSCGMNFCQANQFSLKTGYSVFGKTQISF